MKPVTARLAARRLLPAPLRAQTPAIIAMDQQPHDDPALKNDFWKVFFVRVSPGEPILPHRHDQGTPAAAIPASSGRVG